MQKNKMPLSTITGKAFAFLFFILMIATASSTDARPIKWKEQNKPGIRFRLPAALHC